MSPASTAPSSFDVRQSQGKDSTSSVFLHDLFVPKPPSGESMNVGEDTNCRPFDISISTAGCAAMRCEWKVPLRRAEIRHAIGRLWPGSVLLTQLPRGGCGAQRFHPLEYVYTHRVVNCTAASHQPPGPQLHCTLIPDTRDDVCVADKKLA